MKMACLGQVTPRPPVWFMRQAGRYMEEYRKLRQKYSFMALCHEPDLACEITLQPLKKFNMDAAILFCDILVTAEALGADLDIVENKGPVIQNPVSNQSDLDKLVNCEDALNRLRFVETTLKALRAELGEEKALLGFAGAPFTVASYLIEGGSSKHIAKSFRMIQESPELFSALLEKLTDLTIAYVTMQRSQGVDAVQIFESWASLLPADIYLKHVFPHLKRLITELHDPEQPLILFALANDNLWKVFQDLPVHVLSIGPDVSLRQFQGKAVQGNLDPRWLLCPKDLALEKANQLLHDMRGSEGYIFNLGHGILPQTSPENVHALVDLVLHSA